MSQNFDSAQFRAVLGHVPTSVVVVTGLDGEGKAFGITIGSFASVSLDPPLVGFFPGTRSQSWAAIRESGRVCVNVLGSHQEEGDDKFAGIEWLPSAGGNPVLPGSIAWIDCEIETETVMGDHTCVVGLVTSLDHAESVENAMVFFRGKVSSVKHVGQ